MMQGYKDQRIADGIADRHRHTAAAPIPGAPMHSPYIYPLSQAAPMTALLQDLLPPTGLPIGAPIAYPPVYSAPIPPLSQTPLRDAPRARVHRQTRLYTNRPPLEGPRRRLQSGVSHDPGLRRPIRDWGVGEDLPALVLEEGDDSRPIDLHHGRDSPLLGLDELLLRVLEQSSFEEPESRLRPDGHVLMLSALDDGPKVPKPIIDPISGR